MDDETAEGASRAVYRGILQALEAGSLIPGQRLIEADLSSQFGVGRNAVREAMQRLAARGVVDLNRNRSASIRQIDPQEADEVFVVSGPMTELLFGLAARHFDAERDEAALAEAMAQLKAAHADGTEVVFSRARRGFYRFALNLAANRELLRVFPAIGTHIINAKYQSRRLQTLRLRHYEKLAEAIRAGNAKRAAALARKHNEDMRAAIREHAQLAALAPRRRAAAPGASA